MLLMIKGLVVVVVTYDKISIIHEQAYGNSEEY